jgi:hypothetical protein
MAQLTPKVLYRGQPSTVAASLYAVANTSGYYSIIKNIIICNTTGTDATIDIYSVASGGTAAASNQIFSDLNVKSNETISIDSSLVLAQDESLQGAQVTSNAITMVVSGVEHTT